VPTLPQEAATIQAMMGWIHKIKWPQPDGHWWQEPYQRTTNHYEYSRIPRQHVSWH
jgi:hypothetical protein